LCPEEDPGQYAKLALITFHPRDFPRKFYLLKTLFGSFYEELEQAFDHFPKHHMKLLLGDFNVKVRREIIFKPIIGKESLHQDSNDNGVTSTHRKIWWLKARCSLTGTFTNTPGPPLMVRLTTRLSRY